MKTDKRSRLAMGLALASLAFILITATLIWLPAALGAAGISGPVDPGVVRWGFVAAAAATGMSSLAAGYAVGMVGSAGMGTLAEKPELLGRVLVLVGLAEGIAIYGLIISILILNKLG